MQADGKRLEAALATLAAAEERLSAVEHDTAQHAQQRQDSLSRCITLCFCGFCISAHIQCTGTPKKIGCRLPIECQIFTATKAARLSAMSEMCNWLESAGSFEHASYLGYIWQDFDFLVGKDTAGQ